MAQDRREQRIAIRMLAGMQLNAKQIQRQLQTMHQVRAYSLSSVHYWMARFASGDTATNDRRRSGRPSKITPQLLHDLQTILAREPKSSLLQLSRETGVSISTVHRALCQRLRWKRHPACWIPHFLTDPQCLHRLNVCRTLLRMRANNRDFLSSIITMDESWFFCYDPLSHQGSSEWVAPGAPRPQIVCIERATVKVMLSIWWDCDGVIMRKFIPDGCGINAQFN